MAQKIDPAEIMVRPGVLPPELRRLAAVYGLPYYQTRASCRNGHASPRRTATGKCEDCRMERWQRWRDRHPEKATAHLERMLAEKGKMLN